MSTDNTAEHRRQMLDGLHEFQAVAEVAEIPLRDMLEATHGKDNVWDSDQLRAAFEVQGFLAPMVVVKRKVDGVAGSMLFTHSPRLYFGFVEDK